MSGTVEKFDDLLKHSDLLFVVYYRGHWCPFCLAYLKAFEDLAESIKASNGTRLIVTAEDPKFLPETLSKTKYSGETIVDPENILAAELKSRSLLNVAISEKGGYPHGMAQPAVLVLDGTGKALVSWAIVPGVMNLGGAKDRPMLDEVWKDAQSIKKGDTSKTRETYTKTTMMTGLRQMFRG